MLVCFGPPGPGPGGDSSKRARPINSGPSNVSLAKLRRTARQRDAYVFDRAHEIGTPGPLLAEAPEPCAIRRLLTFHGSDEGKHYAGLYAWDRSYGSIDLVPRIQQEFTHARTAAQRRSVRQKYRKLGFFGYSRFFAGYDIDDTSQVALADGRGRTWIKLYVTKDGHAQLQFLDEQGRVVDAYTRAAIQTASPAL